MKQPMKRLIKKFKSIKSIKTRKLSQIKKSQCLSI